LECGGFVAAFDAPPTQRSIRGIKLGAYSERMMYSPFQISDNHRRKQNDKPKEKSRRGAVRSAQRKPEKIACGDSGL
jgi:hypothetical protein